MSHLIDAIRDGMAENSGDRALCHLGELLTEWTMKNPKSAEDAASEGKTLKGAMDAMRKEAQKAASGNCGVLTDADGVAIAISYFGVKQETQALADSLDLDALMG